MKKILIGGIVFVGAGVGYWLLSPLWRTEVVNEAFPLPSQSMTENTGVPNDLGSSPPKPMAEPEVRELFSGAFQGFDRLHQGSGTATVLQADGKTYLRFESDFSVTNGPDLYVGFGKGGKYAEGSEVGLLKGNVGAQNYELPQGFDAERFDEVYVWCRAFSVPFAKARLSRAQ
jgi:hypothetical protein